MTDFIAERAREIVPVDTNEMKSYLLILPVAALVAYSQIIVKWRLATELLTTAGSTSLTGRVILYLSDPIILSGYAAALLASFGWLLIVAKLPLAIAFPVYIGVTFAMVILGGWIFLAEGLTAPKIVAILLIFSGIVIGVKG